MKKIRVGVLFGGRSGEHEVSLLSAASVLNAIDKKKYEVVPIGITKEGRWVTAANAERLLKGEKASEPEARHLRAGDPQATSAAAVLAKGEGVVVPPMPGHDHSSLMPFESDAPQTQAAANSINVDVIFPVLHGTFGEDGTIQGLLELADIAVCRRGRAGFGCGHGQGRDEAAVPRCRAAHREARDGAAQRLARAAQKGAQADRGLAEVSRVREAGESGIVSGD